MILRREACRYLVKPYFIFLLVLEQEQYQILYLRFKNFLFNDI